MAARYDQGDAASSLDAEEAEGEAHGWLISRSVPVLLICTCHTGFALHTHVLTRTHSHNPSKLDHCKEYHISDQAIPLRHVRSAHHYVMLEQQCLSCVRSVHWARMPSYLDPF